VVVTKSIAPTCKARSNGFASRGTFKGTTRSKSAPLIPIFREPFRIRTIFAKVKGPPRARGDHKETPPATALSLVRKNKLGSVRFSPSRAQWHLSERLRCYFPRCATALARWVGFRELLARINNPFYAAPRARGDHTIIPAPADMGGFREARRECFRSG